MATFYVQTPNEKMHCEIAWSSAIEDGVSISTSTWTVAPLGPTISGTGYDLKTTYFDIADCVAGNDYTVTNKIVLSNGETYESSIFLYTEAK